MDHPNNCCFRSESNRSNYLSCCTTSPDSGIPSTLTGDNMLVDESIHLDMSTAVMESTRIADKQERILPADGTLPFSCCPTSPRSPSLCYFNHGTFSVCSITQRKCWIMLVPSWYRHYRHSTSGHCYLNLIAITWLLNKAVAQMRTACEMISSAPSPRDRRQWFKYHGRSREVNDSSIEWF